MRFQIFLFKKFTQFLFIFLNFSFLSSSSISTLLLIRITHLPVQPAQKERSGISRLNLWKSPMRAMSFIFTEKDQAFSLSSFHHHFHWDRKEKDAPWKREGRLEEGFVWIGNCPKVGNCSKWLHNELLHNEWLHGRMKFCFVFSFHVVVMWALNSRLLR